MPNTPKNNAANDLWYKDAIIYELHIKAFCDGNGDGIGDFEGLLTKLDYLQELGVTAIWLLPFYPSPLRDDGYDIADYYRINPSYGTIEQFKTLLHEAHERNLKVITELVINHTSDTHPWFVRARNAPKGSPERDYYVWTDDPSQYGDVRIIFGDFENSNWTWDHQAQQYYWHRFFHHQPDLNYDNPLVQEEVFRVIDYWCELGVDGFRLDAVPYLYEREGTNGENLPETHEFLKKLRRHIDAHYPGVAFLAEANMWPEDSASYFGNGDECHMNYHFPVMPRMFMALQMEDRYPITDIFEQTPPIPDTCQWAIFLRNHDELTLEMVTDEERDYMYRTYAKDPKARINLGIRHRLAPLMDNNRKKIELLNSLLFSLPGTPVIYYGDEIGMGDNVYLGDRDGVRTPMQWSPDRNAGFSAANPHKLYLPTILDPEYHYESVNVETQRRNTSSLFWFMKRMIGLRRRHPAFGRGDMQFLAVENPKVLAFTRSYGDETLLIVVNLSKYAQPVHIDLPGFAGYVPIEAFSQNPFPAVGDDERYFFTLAPHDYAWFILDKPAVGPVDAATLPQVQLTDWSEQLSNAHRTALEQSVLPAYLHRADWLGDRKTALREVRILTQVAIQTTEGPAWLLLLEVAYERGLPEWFGLVLAFVPTDGADKLMRNCPQAVLATATVGNQTGVLGDGLYLTHVQQALLQLMTGEQDRPAPLYFSGLDTLRAYTAENASPRPKLERAGPYDTTISYDNRFLLKLYRNVDRSENPDTELVRFLAEQANFGHVPTPLGTFGLTVGGEPVQLGMLETQTGRFGNARHYVQDRVGNVIERILARDRVVVDKALTKPAAPLTEVPPFDMLPDETQMLLGSRGAEQVRLLAIRIAEMHLALASGSGPTFAAEPFSLHYQRSLFSGMQSLVRESFGRLNGQLTQLPTALQPLASRVLGQKKEVLQTLQRIYAHKLDALKIRIHGDLQLENILLTGRDIAIRDFGGEPARSYSERRLKRSPLRDVAGLIRSFYDVAYDSFLTSNHLTQETAESMLPLADTWAYYMSGFFLRAYLDTVRPGALIPTDKADIQLMIDTFLIEKALIDLRQNPEQARVPLHLLSSLLPTKQ
ncbi:maltose alpha-D-glucosyltransferase [Rudanella paleaurantiibacter]|uniref:maltose alpha-D-glucosyltransferase n=1 Tax=Rudanella paleaurantiibacter TaxID=2614655 RepID=A0A7J5TYJ5_9BACT|nr:maltose alpha-D-glucosyltransferase [Rudanella paleaurantiibacter]KAB7730017.1 maltose alpha-D-glucosyltransferase [Rudanella paleaurantiibacter]